MELRHLKTFIIVAESGGFTRAGERLGYTQSTITNHIQLLEEEIGSPLFDRLGKKVVLTEVGGHMLSYAQKILALSNEALESSQMNGKPSGTIRIGANESLMIYRLPVILYEFKKKYPQVHIILQPSESQELHNELKSGKFDFALFTNPEKLGVDIVTRSLVKETIVLVAPPSHPLTKQKIVTPADLEGEMLLLTEPGSYRDLLEKWLKEEGVSCSRIHFWSIEAIKQTVMCGLGLSYLPFITVKEEIERGKLIALPWMHSDDFVTTELAYHKSKWLTPAMKTLIKMIEKHAEKWRETI
ncbi:LysR family transcriptional regulator [Bacillus cytotoxicus]|uniref:LysR family transcriptional regulator n=1 Tax=Bacillus cytotoxicus TaxID=580165 RepID=A0ACC6ACI0_9BACI|nr:LysR family transcriptional regulator [Bacillus cytotoxicus]